MLIEKRLALIREALAAKLKEPLFSAPVSQEAVDELNVALTADPLPLGFGGLVIRKAHKVSDSEIGLTCTVDRAELRFVEE